MGDYDETVLTVTTSARIRMMKEHFRRLSASGQPRRHAWWWYEDVRWEAHAGTK